VGRSLADAGSWFIGEGAQEGTPSVLRGRKDLAELRGHPALTKRLEIDWYADSGDADENGLPTVDEAERMTACEDAIVPALERDGLGILVFVLTHAGKRSWTFYVADSEEVGERINDALPHEPPLPIDLSMTDDPEWQEYNAMLQGTGMESERPN
jgi:hypothetical protein